jgi:hypothetical protein
MRRVRKGSLAVEALRRVLLVGWMILSAGGCSRESTPRPDTPIVEVNFDPSRWGRIVVIGDSHAASKTAWPSKLNCAPVENFSYNGSALAHKTVVDPLTTRIYAMSSLFRATDLVIVSLGSNDVGNWTDSEMRSAYRSVRDAIAQTGATQRWTTIPPLSPQWPFADKYEAAIDSRLRWNNLILTTPGARNQRGQTRPRAPH